LLLNTVPAAKYRNICESIWNVTVEIVEIVEIVVPVLKLYTATKWIFEYSSTEKQKTNIEINY
jgi:hypothetical protein